MWDVFAQTVLGAIVKVIIDIVFFVIDAVFTIAKHFFGWIESMIDKLYSSGKDKDAEEAGMLPPEESQETIDRLRSEGKIAYAAPYHRKKQTETIGYVADSNGKIIKAQVISVDKDKGFENSIANNFKQGKIHASKIEN
jgi:hypothetical protein